MENIDIIDVLITAVVGSGGVVGLFFFFIRRYIEKALTKREEEAKHDAEMRMERIRANEELDHAYGRMFFWLHKAIVTNSHNGDLEKAFNDLQNAEEKKKELDRRILAEHIKEME